MPNPRRVGCDDPLAGRVRGTSAGAPTLADPVQPVTSVDPLPPKVGQAPAVRPGRGRDRRPSDRPALRQPPRVLPDHPAVVVPVLRHRAGGELARQARLAAGPGHRRDLPRRRGRSDPDLPAGRPRRDPGAREAAERPAPAPVGRHPEAEQVARDALLSAGPRGDAPAVPARPGAIPGVARRQRPRRRRRLRRRAVQVEHHRVLHLLPGHRRAPAASCRVLAASARASARGHLHLGDGDPADGRLLLLAAAARHRERKPDVPGPPAAVRAVRLRSGGVRRRRRRVHPDRRDLHRRRGSASSSRC